ncbi:hypothetical protein AA0313_1609 [Acetobacter indonesiensis NRIC 0313]|uniref:DUF3465 domain-containing protein n=1 Tax=Acetobacter indonesiensis TaxID=104101 RepID=A0A6N3T6S4_9PROT|nr:DUF3465 domain-containing protein [Acetobacter indonesiensis]GAN61777.1 hypothetical protein Abin_002_033 [Acetobacter indonesiensis]GBQ57885.1 hypothetical protein AA0313_1609 [Acetobacter indonesiensis NRIC 0313]GEN03680.1 hypothetical protein AIN02nite_17050 [Acetobacter indonesiensis]
MTASAFFRSLLAAGILSAGATTVAPSARAAETDLTATVPASCNNQDFLAKQWAFENGKPKADVPVHICGTVIALSPKARRTRSGWHGYFYVAVTPRISIRIVSGLDEMNAPAWPWVNKGDQVEVVGRYYFDSIRRQGIDWTHHGTGWSWRVPGYVVVNGKRYE